MAQLSALTAQVRDLCHARRHGQANPSTNKSRMREWRTDICAFVVSIRGWFLFTGLSPKQLLEVLKVKRLLHPNSILQEGCFLQNCNLLRHSNIWRENMKFHRVHLIPSHHSLPSPAGSRGRRGQKNLFHRLSLISQKIHLLEPRLQHDF